MANSGTIDFNKPRNFSLKMNATYAFFRQNFKPFSKSLLIIAGPPVLVGGIFFIEVFQRLVGSTTGGEAPGPFNVLNQFNTTNFVLQVLAIILFLLLGGVFTVCTTYSYLILYQEKNGKTPEIKEVWERVRKSFWMNFGTMVLYSVFTVIAAIILIFPVALIITLFITIAPVLVVIAYLVYYVFVFFVMINFSLIFVIRNYEKLSFFSAIDKLIYLNKNKWWSTFGIGGVNMYVQYVFSFLLFIPGYTILIITMMHQTSNSPVEKPSFAMEIVSGISFVLYFLGGILLYSLPLVALAFQYFNLVELKQAKGLLMKIENMGTALPPEPDEHSDY